MCYKMALAPATWPYGFQGLAEGDCAQYETTIKSCSSKELREFMNRRGFEMIYQSLERE